MTAFHRFTESDPSRVHLPKLAAEAASMDSQRSRTPIPNATACCSNLANDTAAIQLNLLFPLMAILATILISGSAFGAIAQDRPGIEPPDGVRRMLRVLDAPDRAKTQDAQRAVAEIRLKPPRCDYSGANMSAARALLRAAGFRTIRYLGTTQISTICAKYVHVTACRGRLRHRVDVQFMRHYGRNDGIVNISRQGFCLPPRRVPGLSIVR